MADQPRPLTITRSFSQYDFTSRSFPDDLGTEASGHYIIFNINVPTKNDGAPRTNIRAPQFPTTVTNNLSVVDSLRFQNRTGGTSIPGSSSAPAGSSNLIRNNPNAPTSDLAGLRGSITNNFLSRSTRRITQSIAIFMPNTMVFTEENKYEDISLTAFAMRPLGVALSLGAGAAAAIAGSSAAAARAVRLSDPRGSFLGQAFAINKTPINPRIEVLFSHRPQRQFVFEFMMAPKNEKESETIKNICNTFRFHAAPEINGVANLTNVGIANTLISGAQTVINAANAITRGAIGDFNIGQILASSTLIPPAEFDIAFYKDGARNPHLPNMNTCAIERIEVDYSPTGVYSTFSNGYPVAVRLSIAFREIEVLHKLRIAQGY